MRKSKSVIDEQKIFEYYLLHTIRRSKSQTAKTMGITISEFNKLYENGNWDKQIEKFDREMQLFYKSGKSLRLLHKAITEKLEDSDALEKMSLENTAKLATTLVKLMPDLEAATSIQETTEQNPEVDIYEEVLETMRNDKVCLDYVYKIIDRLEELDENQTKSQK